MIQISRKEQQVLRKLKAVMAAEKAETFTEEMLLNIDPDYKVIESLVEKAILDTETGAITKEPLQVQDDDPEVEQAWEDFRAVQGDGSMSKYTERNKAAEKATGHLEKVLFEKGRLTYMTDGNSHVWATEDKVPFWQGKGYKVANTGAVPTSCQ